MGHLVHYNILEIFHNRILWASLLSWAAAQILKTIINALTTKTWDWKRIVGDGGMPSGHSATVTALAFACGYEYGFDSPLFAIAGILAVVVMHDATGVRLEAGKHAKILNEMYQFFQNMTNPEVQPQTKLKEFLGHTPTQVFFGFLLGVGMATLFELF